MNLFCVDAFTSEPFRGNPAAVSLLDCPIAKSSMQQLAAELNLSEAAFVRRTEEEWDLRWFTPAVEVDLCGHATLASAHILWEEGYLPSDRPAVFSTRASGLLTCTRHEGWIRMDFPARPARPAPPPPGLFEALACVPQWIGRSADDYLIELPTAAMVRELTPDLGRLAQLPVRGVIVTARAETRGDGIDFVSRFFAPAVGIPEDPVTGSAHCTLGPFWAERLKKSKLCGWQCSRRGGEVRVRVDGSRVELSGKACTVWRGELRSMPSAG
jgi:PhzF family phenazine biosynthesis protein